jgi:GNAT superfamily N-acetyltransferase
MNRVDIQPLTPARHADYLHFFDTKAFADNADWSRCYCYFPYCDRAKQEWETRTGDENRASMSDFILRGRAQGYLAYDNNEVVGWCNAAPYGSFRILDSHPEFNDAHAGAIVCFIVCPTHRGQGIATSLLNAACAGLKRQGMDTVYAKPFKGASSTAENYPGPLSMYLAAGFEELKEDEKGNVIVRKQL